MADRVSLEGNYPGGEMFKFTLDNASTYDQMQRLIELTGKLASKFNKNDPDEQKRIDTIMAGAAAYRSNAASVKKTTGAIGDFGDSLSDVKKSGNLLKGDFGGLASTLRSVNNPIVMLGSAASSMVGALLGYAEQLRPALQRGIGGAVMDFAIYAKSAGMSMESFNKALSATEGTFGMLGTTQNEAAKNFSSLINSVRTATGAVGNLGMNNEELAKWTADQLKIAVQQGVRGKAAQDRVIAVSKELGNEFQQLAQRTGKSTAELAQYASKLVMDPTINNYIATLASGGSEVSKAMQKFGSTMGGLFGKQGEELANVAAKSAVAGYPLFTDAMGAEITRVMPRYAGALEEMARKAAAGYAPSDDDRKRLKETFDAEYKERQRAIQILERSGSAEDKAAAIRIEQMYQASRQYDTADGKRLQQQQSAAQEFNKQVNELTATMHQLMVPFLQILNGINWNLMFDVLNGMAKGVKTVTDFLAPLGKMLSDSGVGSVIGGLLGLATIVGIVGTAFLTLRGSVVALAELIAGVARWGRNLGPAAGRGMPGTGGIPGTGGTGGPAGPAGTPGAGKATTGFGKLGEAEAKLAAERTAAEEARRQRVADLYKKYREEGRTATEAKRAAETAATFQPKPTVTERVENFKTGPMASGIKSFIKDWGPTIGLAAAGYAGAKLTQAGEEKLKADPESTAAKLEVGAGKTLEVIGTWGSTILFVNQIMKDYFPDALSKVKNFGTGVAEVASKYMPNLMEKLSTFGSSLGTWSKTLLESPLMGKLAGAAGTYAIAAAGGFAIDAALGAAGVGKEAVTAEEKKRDEANWAQMNWWQKTESGLARSVETVGKLFGLGNMVTEAEKARIRNETEYFIKKELEGSAAGATDQKSKAEKEQTEQLKILNQHMEDLKDEAKVGNIMQNRAVMSAETHEKFLRMLSTKPN